MTRIGRLLRRLAARFKGDTRKSGLWDAFSEILSAPDSSGGKVVEFVGGPLDGYREYLDDLATNRLRIFLQIPITRAVLNGIHPGIHPPKTSAKPSSLAVYELLSSETGDLRYRFCGSTSPVVGLAK